MATSKTRRMSQPERLSRDFESVKATVGSLASVQETQGKQLDSIAKDVLAMRTALVGTSDPLNPSKGSLAAISETENLLASHIKATAEEFAKRDAECLKRDAVISKAVETLSDVTERLSKVEKRTTTHGAIFKRCVWSVAAFSAAFVVLQWIGLDVRKFIFPTLNPSTEVHAKP